MDDDSETILWVYGPAGIGKSTISLTVARSLDDRGLLGASYFFKRGEDDRSDASRFVPTLANQLMAAVPGFRKFLRESLDEPRNVDIEKKAMEVQFDALVRGPLSRVPTTESPHRLTRVIIIDALDECGLELEAKILRLFSKLEGLENLRLRVLVTSRHTHRIGAAFKDLDGLPSKAYRKLALHNAFPEETKEDVAVFLKARFASIREKKHISGGWPDPSDFDRIVNLATSPSPLFIYVTTLCRFIYDGSGRVQPTKRLKGWLEQCDSNTPQLDQIYLPILNYVLFGSYNPGDKPDPLDADEQSELLQILSAIVFLATPLPRRAIAALLDIPEHSVNHHLENLHAVLDAPSDSRAPVRILHQSFRDFIVGYKGEDMSSILPLDEKETHALLARQCIRLMESKPLKRDICDINDPGRLRRQIKDTLVSEHISTELAYACRFWVHSQVLHGRFVLDEEQVYKFLREHLLHWIECLSLLRKLPDVVSSVRKLSAAFQARLIIDPCLVSKCWDLLTTFPAGTSRKLSASYILTRRGGLHARQRNDCRAGTVADIQLCTCLHSSDEQGQNAAVEGKIPVPEHNHRCSGRVLGNPRRPLRLGMCPSILPGREDSSIGFDGRYPTSLGHCSRRTPTDAQPSHFSSPCQ